MSAADITITRETSETRGRYIARVTGHDETGKLTFSISSATLVIADHQRALAIAGVMGGEHSGVSGKTDDPARGFMYYGDYGAGGFPAWGIPPNGTLKFTLECLKVA